GKKAVVNGEFAGEVVASAGGLDGVDVADEVGDGDVGRGEFFYVAFAGFEPSDFYGVSLPGDEVLTTAANWRVGIVVNFAAGDVGHLGIEEAGESAQDAAFGLSAKA